MIVLMHLLVMSSISAHVYTTLQVRSLAITPEGVVVTGSRDKSIKLWAQGEDETYRETATLVSALAKAWTAAAAGGSRGGGCSIQANPELALADAACIVGVW